MTGFAWQQDVAGEVAAKAPLRVAFCSAKGLALAGGGGFNVSECHLDLEGRAGVLSALRCHPLAARLVSITLCDWSVAKEEVLQYIQDACDEGARLSMRSPLASAALSEAEAPPVPWHYLASWQGLCFVTSSGTLKGLIA